MLRIGYLPSDFNPMLLLLGEAEDFRALAGVLRRFARGPAAVRLDGLAFCAPGASILTLAAQPGPLGITPTAAGLVWRLDPLRAAGFATQLDALAEPHRLAGSEMLECSTEEDIPVKASRGEYTEDFLRPPAAARPEPRDGVAPGGSCPMR